GRSRRARRLPPRDALGEPRRPPRSAACQPAPRASRCSCRRETSPRPRGNFEVMRYLNAVRDVELKRRLGSVTEYHGLVVESAGPDVFVGELCEVHSRAPARSVAAEVIGIRNGRVLLMPYEELRGLSYGAEVVATGRTARAAVGDALLGRVVDAFGAPLDNGPPLALAAAQPLYPSPINPLARTRLDPALGARVRLVDTPLTR